MLTGDFNLHFDINNGFKNVTWTNLLLEYCFLQMIKLPTRVTAKSSSIIDHMYSTHPEPIIETCVPSISISDHVPVCFTRRTSQSSFGRHKTISYRSFKHFDEHAFVNDLISKELDKCETSIDPNVALEYLYQQINSAISKHAPLRCKRVKRDMLPEWFNDDIKQAIKLRDHCHKIQDFSKYRTHRNKVVNVIKRAKRTFYTHAVRKLPRI